MALHSGIQSGLRGMKKAAIALGIKRGTLGDENA
jgi:hypothetical protein